MMNRRTLAMIFVILAGEAVFMLPFLIPRLYRPLMLEAWALTNTDIGVAFAAYGVWAMISYPLGGPLADKYHPRVLISASLVLTAAGGLFLAWFPSPANLIAIYGFFGVSTIFLMWGALIKTTHVAGGQAQRSLAMGILDGGRGLTAALFASLLVLVTTIGTADLNSSSQQRQALNTIYIVTAAFTLIVAAGIWFTLGEFQSRDTEDARWELRKTVRCLKDIRVWLLGLVVLGAYCGYKSVDNYSVYMVDVHKVGLAASSQLTSILFWLRPVTAVAVGAFADGFHKRNSSGRLWILFVLLVLAGLTHLLLALTGGSSLIYAFTVILASAAFAYALRAIYFSVFGDLQIPFYLVGTTTGLVSFVGFLPDVFFGWATGRLIDTHPGEPGFQLAFAFTAFWLFAGAAASFALIKKSKI